MAHQEHTKAGEVEDAAGQGGEAVEAEIQVGETPQVANVWWQACQGAMLTQTKFIPGMATWVWREMEEEVNMLQGYLTSLT